MDSELLNPALSNFSNGQDICFHLTLIIENIPKNNSTSRRIRIPVLDCCSSTNKKVMSLTRIHHVVFYEIHIKKKQQVRNCYKKDTASQVSDSSKKRKKMKSESNFY
jgi:hypothetical protein